MVEIVSRPAALAPRECGACAHVLQGLPRAGARQAGGRLVPPLRPPAPAAPFTRRGRPIAAQFFCLWMTDPKVPDVWKPDRSHIVLSIFPANGFIYAQVDPGSPQAWRKAPYYDDLRRMAQAVATSGIATSSCSSATSRR